MWKLGIDKKGKKVVFKKKNCSEFQTEINSVFGIDISIDSLHKHSVHICNKCVRKIIAFQKLLLLSA